MSERHADLGHRAPRLGTLLIDPDEDTVAITVAKDSDPLDALLALLEESTGERFERDNSFLVGEAKALRVEEWRSCTKQWREDNNADDNGFESYWAPDGDGRRWCYVVSSDRSPWVTAELAAAAEQHADFQSHGTING